MRRSSSGEYLRATAISLGFPNEPDLFTRFPRVFTITAAGATVSVHSELYRETLWVGNIERESEKGKRELRII